MNEAAPSGSARGWAEQRANGMVRRLPRRISSIPAVAERLSARPGARGRHRPSRPARRRRVLPGHRAAAGAPRRCRRRTRPGPSRDRSRPWPGAAPVRASTRPRPARAGSPRRYCRDGPGRGRPERLLGARASSSAADGTMSMLAPRSLPAPRPVGRARGAATAPTHRRRRARPGSGIPRPARRRDGRPGTRRCRPRTGRPWPPRSRRRGPRPRAAAVRSGLPRAHRRRRGPPHQPSWRSSAGETTPSRR